MTDLVGELYDPQMAEVRREVAKTPAFGRLVSPDVPPKVLERFLIEYCAQGVQITEPVEGWIRRAGQHCQVLGYQRTGMALLKHAAHEAGHDRLFVADTRYLVRRWNERFPEYLDEARLLSQPASPGMLAYIALHEEVIASDAPYGQVAIEYEIERLSVDLLPMLLASLREKLGEAVLGGLSFLTEHAAIDVGHTKLNRVMMERLLAEHEGALSKLVDAGSRALRAYLAFFDECLQVAETCSSCAQPVAGAHPLTRLVGECGEIAHGVERSSQRL